MEFCCAVLLEEIYYPVTTQEVMNLLILTSERRA